jgi:hypothetical protein
MYASMGQVEELGDVIGGGNSGFQEERTGSAAFMIRFPRRQRSTVRAGYLEGRNVSIEYR